MKTIRPLVLSLCALLAAPSVAATKIMPLGDSITEGLCSDGSNANTSSSTCYVPYYEPQNAAIYNHYDSEPTFCGEFARHMVEDFNHGASGGYRGPLLTLLRAAGMSVNYVGHERSGSALAAADQSHDGHGNWLAEQLDYCANGYPAHAGMPAYGGYVADLQPNIVLLQIGTNNVFNGAGPAPLAALVVSLQHKVEHAAPNARVIVALIPKRYDFSTNPPQPQATFETGRSTFSRLLAQGSGKDSPCAARDIVDLSVLTADDITSAAAAGGAHPNMQGYAKIARIWAAAISAAPCRFDTRSFVTLGNTTIESITAYGRFWNYDAGNWTPMESGPLNTSDIPRYASICAGQPVCTFDTRTFIGDAAAPIESITAFDHYYDFAVDGTPIANGSLTSVSRYAAICALSSDANHCVFDTRAVADRGASRVETITAYGRHFDFDLTSHAALGSAALASVARYAPICALKPAADPSCRFDTRAFMRLPGSTTQLESITAYGRYWNFNATDGHLVDTGALADVGRYRPDAIFANSFDH